jgi:hypothetical protein
MTHKTIAKFALIGVIAMSATGCGTITESRHYSEASSSQPAPSGETDDMAKLIYLAAQTLSDRSEVLDKAHPIVVATIVSVDDLNASSTFGRLASQLVANRIAQRGYLVRDVNYMHALAVGKTGELVLSREATKISESFSAQAVVAGTYAVAGEEIYLNLRLLRTGDPEHSGELLSSVDVVIPRNENTEPLLGEAPDQLIPYSRYTFDSN